METSEYAGPEKNMKFILQSGSYPLDMVPSRNIRCDIYKYSATGYVEVQVKEIFVTGSGIFCLDMQSANVNNRFCNTDKTSSTVASPSNHTVISTTYNMANNECMRAYIVITGE